MSQVRIGVVGAGLIGRKHIAVLRAGGDDFALAGVADPSAAAKAEAGALGYRCFETVEALLEGARPDGVVIAVPNQLHVSTGLACVAAGVPILIEKPVADTVGEALRLVDAAAAKGVATLTGHHRRHNPILRRAAELIRDGAVGRVVAATSTWLLHKPEGYHEAAWRRQPGGGPVLINAIHEIDCLRMLVGEIATVQAAQSNAVRGFDVEDTAAAILTFETGALATLMLSDTVSSPFAWETTSGENPAFPKAAADSILIGGTRGSLSIPSLDLRWHEPGAESWMEAPVQKRMPVVPADPYVEQMGNFAAVIRGEAEPVLTGCDGVTTLAATLAITRSAGTGGGPVRVADMLAEGMEGGRA
jgi:predicted dehydrogenase